MNDKDKEEYEKWLEAQNWYYDSFNNEYYQNGLKISIYGETEEAWQAACEYKQKEIDELKNVTYWQVEQDGKVTRHISIADIETLQAENAKLIECLKFTAYAAEYLFKPDEYLVDGLFPTSYFTLSYEGDLELIEKTKRARQVLKELEGK